MEKMIDLRSDTVTLPTEEMIEAIRKAELGDDVFKEDPTVNKLEEIAAEKTGKEAALLVTSGTQANLISVMSNTNRGESVILEQDSHICWYEAGGISTIGGVFPISIKGKNGFIHPKNIKKVLRVDNIHFPKTTLICIENTHNRAGGTIITPDQIKIISEFAEKFNLKLYMDGARIFNAAVALKKNVKEFTQNIDNLMFCLSKGLSCPVGSIIAGSKKFIKKARKNRKLLGGSMRQAGIIAAPGIIALENMIPRLKEDHDNAKFLAVELKKLKGINLNFNDIQTNIVNFTACDLGFTSDEFILKLKTKGVLATSNSNQIIRMVTHRGIKKEHIIKTIEAIKEMIQSIN